MFGRWILTERIKAKLAWGRRRGAGHGARPLPYVLPALGLLRGRWFIHFRSAPLISNTYYMC